MTFDSLDPSINARSGRLILIGILIVFWFNALQDPFYWIYTNGADRTSYTFIWPYNIYIGLVPVVIASWYLWQGDQWARWVMAAYLMTSGAYSLGRYLSLSSMWLDPFPAIEGGADGITSQTFFWWAIAGNVTLIVSALLLIKSASIDAYFRRSLQPPSTDPSTASLFRLIKVRNEERRPRAKNVMALKGEHWILILLYFFAAYFLIERVNDVFRLSADNSVTSKGIVLLRFGLEVFLMLNLYRGVSWARLGLALYCWVWLGLGIYGVVAVLGPQLATDLQTLGHYRMLYGAIWSGVFHNTILLASAALLSFSPAINAFFAEAGQLRQNRGLEARP